MIRIYLWLQRRYLRTRITIIRSWNTLKFQIKLVTKSFFCYVVVCDKEVINLTNFVQLLSICSQSTSGNLIFYQTLFVLRLWEAERQLLYEVVFLHKKKSSLERIFVEWYFFVMTVLFTLQKRIRSYGLVELFLLRGVSLRRIYSTIVLRW